MITEDQGGVTITAKGNYAELHVQRGESTWKMLIDEKNLAKLLLQGRTVLNQMREIPENAT